MDIHNLWINLLIDTTIARHYDIVIGNTPALKIGRVESVIVGSLLIRAISLLDYSLEEYIGKEGIRFDSKVGNPKLYDRLLALEKENRLLDYKDIDSWRKRRNDVGHKIDDCYTWTDLNLCLTSVFRELKNMKLLSIHPNMTLKKITRAIPPTKEGTSIEQDILIEVYESEITYYKFGWKRRIG